jgi:cation-transporting P-type ATPase C
VAGLRDQPQLARAVEATLSHAAGVRRCVANPRTGRILVEFDPAVPCSRIAALLAAARANPRHDLAAAPRPADGRCGHDHDHGPDCGHDHDHDGDLTSQVRNLIVGGGVLLGVLAKRWLWGPAGWAASPALLTVSAAAAVVSGFRYLRGTYRSAVGDSGITTDTLVGSATLASIVMRESVTALTVIWLLNLGEYLQALTLRRTRQAIRDLLKVGAEEVWLVAADGTEVQRPLAEVRPGDLVAVYAGDAIPVDGAIEAGSGTINQAPITGESIPVMRNPGDGVFAGTILLAGDLRVRVQRVGADTAVGRLIRRVEQAQELRAPIQTIGDQFSRRFVPASFALAGVVLLVTGDLRRSLTMLLIACPCAAGLATPTAVSAAIGNGARRGVLIKGGTHLEAAAHLDTIVFDKTGTLTQGLPTVERVIALDPAYSADEVLSIAATGELHSQHPLALAVVGHARDRELVIPPHEECQILVGRGMHATGDGIWVLVGNRLLLEQFGVPIPAEAEAIYAGHAAAGETMMYVAHQQRLIGLIGVRDKVRAEAADALTQLRQAGVRHLLMLTGDGSEAAGTVARNVGLTEWRHDLLPEEKYDIVQSLRAAGRSVAMVGDGINDAPALALADVGIAMGTAGSDVAIEAADIALAGDDLRGVVTTVRLSQRALQIIRQNYALALGVNAGGIVIGALGYLNPLLAAALHNLSTLLVVINSARLIGYDPEPRRP